jgi:hypothetical protein
MANQWLGAIAGADQNAPEVPKGYGDDVTDEHAS